MFKVFSSEKLMSSFFQTVTSVEYKFNLREIRNTKLVEKRNDMGVMSSLLSVKNIDDIEFFLDIKKFLPERCIPKLEFSNKYFELTNSMIWGTSIFWIFDGMMCVKDLDRFSNMSLVEAKIYWGEEQVSKIFPIDHTVCRVELITPSLKTLSQLALDGDLMWAPIPDSAYKSNDGRDLNLEVINSMRVSILC
jgi:hypothetical protein